MYRNCSMYMWYKSAPYTSWSTFMPLSVWKCIYGSVCIEIVVINMWYKSAPYTSWSTFMPLSLWKCIYGSVCIDIVVINMWFTVYSVKTMYKFVIISVLIRVDEVTEKQRHLPRLTILLQQYK